MSQNQTPNNLAAYCWSIADLLRGDFKQSQYGRIILPFTLLRRLEGVLEESKEAVLAEYEKVQKMNLPEDAQEKLLMRATKTSKNQEGLSFFNTSKMDLSKLGETGIKDNLESYIQGFSKDAREIFEYFNFAEFIGQLNDADLLYKVVQEVRKTDLSPQAISNHDMGLTFEELIRRFAEGSNETAGEHFTPRDIVRLTTSLVFMEDDALSKSGIIRTIYDPTAGTGGFLSSGMEYVHELNPNAVMRAFGQELNPESYAICKADMLIKGQEVNNIKLGNTLSNDHLYAEKFDYMLSNPPFALDWKKIEGSIKDEHTLIGFDGRFGPGLPRVSDGSLLFLLHLIKKLRDSNEGGGRIGIILNGSPLFTGGAGSGESEIRRYLIEKDLLEGVVILPEGMHENTSIKTYILILTNRKPDQRKGKVQIIDTCGLSLRTRNRKGSKSHYLDDSAITEILKKYEEEITDKHSKLVSGKEFGYRRIKLKVNSNNEYENVPLEANVEQYLSEQLKDVYSKYIIDRNYVDEKDGDLGVVGYEYNLDVFEGRYEKGKQFRNYFKEVSESDEWSFSLNRTFNKAFFRSEIINSELNTTYKHFFKAREIGRFDLDYLKLFFNSELWSDWLVTYKAGSKLGNQSKYEFLRRKIKFPKLEEQRQKVEILEGISKWRNRLQSLESDVWNDEVGVSLSEKSRLPVSKDLQEQIIDVAPYPFANMLHHYKNLPDNDYKSKYELLLKLHESLAIYLVSIMAEYIDREIESGFLSLLFNDQKRYLRNSTYGTWVVILDVILKRLDMARDAGEFIFIENILDVSLVKIFKNSLELRNRTSGHGSYPTVKAAREILYEVEKINDQVMDRFYVFFEKLTLVRPVNSTWDGKVHNYQVEDFRGLGCYPFGLREVMVKVPFVSGELYLISNDGSLSIRVFPFINLIDMDEDSGLESFYFYSKLNSTDPQASSKELLYISHQQINKQSQICVNEKIASIFER